MSTGISCRPSGARPAFRTTLPETRLPRYAVSWGRSHSMPALPRAAKGDSSEPNHVQEELVSQIQSEIEKKKVDKEVDALADDMRAMVERVKEDTDSRSRQYMQESMDVMDNKLTDLMAELDEYEAVLKRSRQESAENAQELSEWKRDVARRRSKGHFFQSLYTADKEDEERPRRTEEGSRSPAGAAGRADSGRASAEAIQGVAASATSQSLSRGLLVALGSVLLAVVIGDLLSDDPSARADVPYTCLAGLAFWLAWRGVQTSN
ncbi:hypothetical protein ACKKBF_B03970 [Auxenochlorella protothecoides x Auxenochlorella symbiontica]